MEEERITFNWGDLICKVLFLVAFVLILLWLYPNNNLSPFYDRIFNENIQSMKDAAKDYFTVDRLPNEDGGTIEIKLGDMIDAKMLLEFTDEDGKTCDLEDSYVEAKRVSSDKYELKVSLTCGKKTDYIIDTIGCYDVCEGKECTSVIIDEISTDDSTSNDGVSINIDNASTIEYEFKKSINKMDYSCDSGFVLSGTHCYRSSVLDSYKATLVTTDSKKVTTDAQKTNGSSTTVYDDPKVTMTYVCSEIYDNAGTYNVPTVCKKTNIHTAASVKQTTYTCSSEYINAGTYNVPTVCYKKANTTEDAKKVTKYVCSSEYDNAGTYNVATTCKKTTTAAATPTTVTKYVCSSSYDNAGTYSSPTTCKKTTTAAATSSTTTKYTCSSSYDNAGTYSSPTTCKKTTTAAATANTTTTPGTYTNWDCGDCSTRTYISPKSSTSTTKYDPRGTGTQYVCSSSYCPGYVTVYYYVVYTRSYQAGTTTTTYTCSSSYDNAGTYSSPTTCKKTTTAAATSSSTTTYTCSISYDNAGTYNIPTTCKKTTTAAATVNNTYTCSSEFTNAGTYNTPTTCIKTSTAGYAATQKDKYSCSSEYDNAGIYNTSVTCSKKEVSTQNSTINSKYTCASGFNAVGDGDKTTCTKVISTPGKYYCSDASATLVGDKCVKTVAGGTKYTCASGYHLSGTYCIKYKYEEVAAKATCKVDHYEYKWSTELELDGWGRTGKYRVTAYNKDLEQEPGCEGCGCNTTSGIFITCPESGTCIGEDCLSK